jgi:hypothetical protein
MLNSTQFSNGKPSNNAQPWQFLLKIQLTYLFCYLRLAKTSQTPLMPETRLGVLPQLGSIEV